MSLSYPWYSIVKGPDLEQGDLIRGCPVIEPIYEPLDPEEETYSLEAKQLNFDIVILSQTCDLINDKIDSVLVSPFHPVDEFIDANTPNLTSKARKSAREEIRRGYRPSFHMLARCDFPKFEHDIQIIDFQRLFTVPKSLLVQLAELQGERIRLMPPYREHLGQSFARYFMRVGLPIDIPSQK